MNIPIRILLLDDQLANGTYRLRTALKNLGAGEVESRTNAMTLDVGSESHLEISWDGVDDPEVAHEYLLDAERLSAYQLILLDNRWNEKGRADDYGVKLLEEAQKAGVHHPLLAIFTQESAFKNEDAQRALAAGARAFVNKGEAVHLVNLLILASELA